MTWLSTRTATRRSGRACSERLFGSRGEVTGLRLAVTDPAREVYVAVHDNEIAGFIVVVLQGAFIGYIQAICVAPAARAQGIGTRLIDFAEARIGQVSPNVFLCVSDFNPRARALYERRGYQLVGELKDYLIRGHSELLMRKTTGPLREITGQRASGTGKGHVS